MNPAANSKELRMYLKHRAEPGVYAVATDPDGIILKALDLTDENSREELCPHMLTTLPLVGSVDDLEYLNSNRALFEVYVPECGDIHHLMRDLVDLERSHRRATEAFSLADSQAKSLKKEMDAAGAKVHTLLARIGDRKTLPLFESV